MSLCASGMHSRSHAHANEPASASARRSRSMRTPAWCCKAVMLRATNSRRRGARASTMPGCFGLAPLVAHSPFKCPELREKRTCLRTIWRTDSWGTGLVRQSVIPASKQRESSTSIALAVSATIGTCSAQGETPSCMRRMSCAAWRPVSMGMLTSMTIMSKSAPLARRSCTMTTASSPLCASQSSWPSRNMEMTTRFMSSSSTSISLPTYASLSSLGAPTGPSSAPCERRLSREGGGEASRTGKGRWKAFASATWQLGKARVLRTKVNVEPAPKVDSTPRLPPMALASSLQMVSPMPEALEMPPELLPAVLAPHALVGTVSNRSKMRRSAKFGMPTPVSVTCTWSSTGTHSRASSRTASSRPVPPSSSPRSSLTRTTSDTLPCMVYLMALVPRFVSTCWMRCESPRSTRMLPWTSTRKSTLRFCSAIAESTCLQRPATDSITSCRSKSRMLSLSLPCCTFDMSNTSHTSTYRCSADRSDEVMRYSRLSCFQSGGGLLAMS
mmetsp:Transcript_9462/g.27645  ORF Transcript_9462/g.27645 Transcript_9462/m.27645 type:complete len:500 (+) Transcript_9462:146-1645(+)